MLNVAKKLLFFYLLFVGVKSYVDISWMHSLFIALSLISLWKLTFKFEKKLRIVGYAYFTVLIGFASLSAVTSLYSYFMAVS